MFPGIAAGGGLTRSGRWARALVTVVAASAVILLGGASPAAAEAWPINDSFENQPHTRWEDYHVDTAGAHFTGGDHLVRTGSTAVMIQAHEGWASMERWITLNPSGGARVCGASVYGFALKRTTQGGTATVHLEIIDPVAWEYVSFAAHELVKTSVFDSWQQINFGNFLHTSDTILVRMALVNTSGEDFETVLLDDFTLWCSRPIS